MQKLTVSDFAGGINESVVPDDFSDRQWAILKGIVPTSDTLFESQWAIQTIGTSGTNFVAVYPLHSDKGTFLVGLKTDGTVWWAKAPAANATFASANAAVWSQITTAANVGWASGNGAQPTLYVHPNPTYKFIASIPFEAQKYARTPDGVASSNVSKDADNNTVPTGLASGVMINSSVIYSEAVTSWTRAGGVTTLTVGTHSMAANQTVRVLGVDPTVNGVYMISSVNATTISIANAGPDTGPNTVSGTVAPSSQVLVAYVDPAGDGSVKICVFPNFRRLPTHGDSGDFINGRYLDGSNVSQVNSMPTWPKDAYPEVYMHPYTYIDAAGTLLPGNGIVPRGNVGTVKGGTVILGDIEWRTTYATAAEALDSVDLTNSLGSNLFGVDSTQITWPAGVATTARMIYNDGPGVVYLKDDANVSARIVAKKLQGNVATLTTSSAHGFVAGEKIEVFNVDGTFNGQYTISNSPAPTTTAFSYARTAPNILGKDLGGGNYNPVYIIDAPTKAKVDTNVVTLTLAGHGLTSGDVVYVRNVGEPYNSPAATGDTLTAVTTDTLSYARTWPNIAEADVTATQSTRSRVSAYDYRVEAGAYQAIPNSWGGIYAAADTVDTKIKAARQLNLANHLLNDNNTGPFRGGIYFSTGDIDTFDPRAMLLPAKTDVRIAGMHVLDDTIIAITQRGSNGDGAFRIRGYLSRLINYAGTSDPTAVSIELIRGGVGAPARTTDEHRYYSTVWGEAGVVVFIDAQGGVYYTNGQECDRLDRYGPALPNVSEVTDLDHAAAFGRSLLVYRAGRLLCFTIMSSGNNTGSGCWTELVVPGAIKNMVGSEEALYFIYDGKVQRFAPSAPTSERGRFNNTALTITVGTKTFGDSGSHRRVNWHRFGMTYTSPTSCTVKTVKVQSTGVLRATGTVSLPDVQYTVALDRTHSDPGVLGEFVIPAGIGPQAMASATVTFEGYVQLQSASFWITGSESRSGDK